MIFFCSTVQSLLCAAALLGDVLPTLIPEHQDLSSLLGNSLVLCSEYGLVLRSGGAFVLSVAERIEINLSHL